MAQGDSSTAFVTGVGLGGLALTMGLLSWLIASGVRRWAGRIGLNDEPGERSLHSWVTPRGGGLGIVAGSTVGWMLAAGVGWGPDESLLTALLVGGLMISSISLVDDFRGVPAWIRLVVQVGAAAAACRLLGPVQVIDVGGFGPISLGFAGTPLTIVWIVGVVNVFNFMDGVDGLAAGQAVVTSLAWMVIGAGTGERSLVVVPLMIAAGSAGFLLHNWSPARLFMGDVGSAFLGFALAAIAVHAAHRAPLLFEDGVIFLWPFLADAGFTLMRRARKRENVFQAHRTHLYQRLAMSGWTHQAVCVLYLALGLISAVLGGIVTGAGRPAALWVLLALVGIMVVVWRIVVRREQIEKGFRT